MSKIVTVIVIGAGSRGSTYAGYIEKHPEEAKIIGVAEPRDFYRNRMATAHKIPKENCWLTWEDVAKLPKMADAVLICTQDAMHEAPALAFAKLGYDILLEKPMAPTEDACRRIAAAVKAAAITFAVCHVLRYTAHTQCVKKVISSGALGDIVSIQHLEPVKHWHQAHSFVRGNWRNEGLSSCMLLQKCCHDLDWLRYVMNKSCKQVQSFGNLYHFKPENQPKGAADRCTDCPAGIEANCPYSAVDFYLRHKLRGGQLTWPLNVITTDMTEEGVTKALKEGPYGRCVYKCDNDVVDHQVVNMLFEDNSTASMTMTAFCDENGRQTRIFGTKGCLRTDSQYLYVTDYLTNETRTIDTNVSDDGGILSGHGGGDGGLISSFIHALQTGDKSLILSGTDETLESHLMVFAAERSRHENTICKIEHE